MTTPNSPQDDEARELRRTLGKLTRRGFAWGGAATLVGFAASRWIGKTGQVERQPWPLRKVLEADERLGRLAFGSGRLSRSFPPSLARMPRVNGNYGLDPNLDLDAWRVKVEGPAGSKSFALEAIKALPRFEVTTELRCIEGWSEVVTWAGARLADLAAMTGLATRSGNPGEPQRDPGDLLPFAALVTPDSKYYVGLDMPSALHPQTLLCYEMNGAPLTPGHGAPLRLAVPVKYGIKSLKQIGTIRFGESKPDDFWAKLGYDWYAGL